MDKHGVEVEVAIATFFYRSGGVAAQLMKDLDAAGAGEARYDIALQAAKNFAKMFLEEAELRKNGDIVRRIRAMP